MIAAHNSADLIPARMVPLPCSIEFNVVIAWYNG
jgi:hypothetical protein